MNRGLKIGLIVAGILAAGGLIWWAISAGKNKSGNKTKDDRRITFQRV